MIDAVFEVTASVPGKSFGVNTVEGPYTIIAEYELEESPDAKSTHIHFSMTARSDSRFTAVLFILTGWFAKSFLRRMLDKELDELAIALT